MPFKATPCASPLLSLMLTLESSTWGKNIMDVLKTLEVDRESVDRFLRMSSYERARKTDLSQATWSRWISGDRSPTLETIKTIAPKLEMGYVELTLGLMVLRQELSAA